MKTPVNFAKTLLGINENDTDTSVIDRVRNILNGFSSDYEDTDVSENGNDVTFIVDMSRVGQLMADLLGFCACVAAA